MDISAQESPDGPPTAQDVVPDVEVPFQRSSGSSGRVSAQEVVPVDGWKCLTCKAGDLSDGLECFFCQDQLLDCGRLMQHVDIHHSPYAVFPASCCHCGRFCSCNFIFPHFTFHIPLPFGNYPLL
jgi:hypothetical protein